MKLGSGGSLYDAALLLAHGRGYFVEQALAAELVPFNAPAAVLPPVVAGQLDAGTAAPSVDVFDALARERAAPRVVASAGQAAPGFSPAALLLRDGLRLSSATALRGRPLGADLYGPGGRNVALALARLGLREDDVYLVDLPPEHAAAALAEGQLDAAYAVEPDVAELVGHQRAQLWFGVDELDPGQELAVLLFSPNLVAHRPAIASRILTAYLRGLQDYRAAVATAAGRDAVRRELGEALGLDEVAVVSRLALVYYPADGHPNTSSLAATQRYYLDRHRQARPADLERAVDLQFLTAAATALAAGPPP